MTPPEKFDTALRLRFHGPFENACEHATVAVRLLKSYGFVVTQRATVPPIHLDRGEPDPLLERAK